ncbi:MAG: tripartite tricarboxylate transporter TctB family protein [Pseudomonadota bacterium]
MRIAELIMAVALAALSLGIMWKAGETPVWKGERFSNIGFDDTGAPGTGFWPFWVCAIMFVCSIWVFVNGLLRLSPPSQSTEPYLDSHGVRVLLTVGIPVFLLVLLTDYISMYFSMALFILYYLLVLGRHGLLLSGALALVLPFWMFLFFDITMTRTLPKGVLVIEDSIYVPLGNFFRQMDGSVVGLCFLAGGAILVAAAVLSGRRGAEG